VNWRIDITAHSPFLGYTTERGAIAVHSTDLLSSGLSGIEVIFHEMQHQREIMGVFSQKLEAVNAQTGGRFPADLGHALIYATAGEVTRRIALAEGEVEFTPLWTKQSFELSPMWDDIAAAIEVHWLPAVRAERSVDAALQALARTFE
jgi:hypothetical protein